MKKRVYCVVCFCILVSILLCACGKKEEENAVIITFQASVMEINEDSILVKPADGSPELASADAFHISNEENLALEIGDLVEISYNGEIMESYPAQLGEVYKITVVEQAGN